MKISLWIYRLWRWRGFVKFVKMWRIKKKIISKEIIRSLLKISLASCTPDIIDKYDKKLRI